MTRPALFIPLLLLVSTAPVRTAPAEPATKLIVFANRSTPVNKLSTGELRSVLLGEVPQWSNGRPVTLLLVEDRSMARALKAILKMSKDDYVAHFLTAEYRGSGLVKPKLVSSIDAALQYLTSTPGAITVLAGEPDMTVAGAKAVRIDGKLPEDEGYRY